MNDAARKIAEAFVALTKALPGVDTALVAMDREPYRVTLYMKSDAAATRLCALFGVPAEIGTWGHDSMRLQSNGMAGTIGITIIGESRPTKPVQPLTESKVEAALAKTEAAIAEVSR